jgi:prepilin-type N-terminal cleavage/methylation domain-containing protein
MTGMASMRCKRGFTLIEIVIALVLAGLLASLAGPMLSGAIKGNAKMLQNLSGAVTLQSQMEKISSCYTYGGTKTYDAFNTCVTNNINTDIVKVADKTGYCKLVGSSFVVDATATSSKLFMVTLKAAATGETLTMIFSGS